MFDCFLAQILVLIIIFFCSVRVLFLRHSRVDCLAAFAPAALILSILIFFCFDFSLQTLCLFLLSVLVFFTNFRAILRLHAQLIVDSYSVGFVMFSIINLILSLALAAILIMFRPVKYNAKDFGITKTQHTLTGSASNLRIRESYFTGESFSGDLFIYKPVLNDEITANLYSENPVIIFTPGIRATVQNYEPYLMLLAQKGYTVLAADFYTADTRLLSKNTENLAKKRLLESKFFRRFAALASEMKEPEKFEKIVLEEQEMATRKYSSLTRIALELFGDETKVFYIVDGVDFDSIYAVVEEFNTEPYSNAKGFFSMNRVDEYKSGGYGFIEQTDILLAHDKGLERENKFFIARYVANKTIKAITEQK